MRRAAKVDDNQGDIVKALRAVGCLVAHTPVGNGFPDLAVGYRGRIVLLEVKDGRKVPSARKLNENEVKFHQQWAGLPVYVVECVEDALAAVGVVTLKSTGEVLGRVR